MVAGKLAVSLIQMRVQQNPWRNAQTLEAALAGVASSDQPCELAVGVELGIAPGPVLPEQNEIYPYLGDMAARYGVYLLPGSLKIKAEEGGFYNQAPVFGPDGALLGRCNKTAPADAGPERGAVSGSGPLAFDIQEKGIRAGLLLGRDAGLSGVFRSPALAGPGLIIRMCMETDAGQEESLELNQSLAGRHGAYVVYTNATGSIGTLALVGGSQILDPEGGPLYSAGAGEAAGGAALDLGLLRP